MHQPLAFQHLDQRLELEIAARWDRLFATRHLRVVILPLLLIDFRFGERFTDHILHAHARSWIPEVAGGPEAVGIAGALRVLAERKLDPRHRALEDHVVGILAPAHLEDSTLAADRVGAAMQNIGRGDTARQRAIDLDVLRIEYIFDAYHRGNRDAAFVDAVGGNVRMAIDNARHDVLPARIDDLGALRHIHLFARFD